MSQVLENLDLRAKLENLYESLDDRNGSSKMIVESYIKQLDLRSDYSILRDCVAEMVQYDWLNQVGTFINESTQYVRDNEISFSVLNTLESLHSHRNKETFTSAINILEELKDLSESELRKRLPNKMATHSWVPGIKELISLTESLSGKNSSTNNNVTSKRTVSPVLETESGEFIFNVGKRHYSMNESGEIKLANKNDITSDFYSLTQLAENFSPTEEGLRMRLSNGIVDITVNENEDGTITKELKLDGAKLDENHLSSSLMATGKFRAGEYDVIKVLEHAVHSAEKLVELDFVETITSNVYEGVEVNILKTDNGVYVNKINTYMNENVLIKPETASDAINLVMEYVNYDITNSVRDLLEGEAKIEEGRKKEENDIYERIDFIKNEISKISELGMDEMAEIKEAKKILSDSLAEEQAKLNAMFKTKNVEVHEASDADYVPGELKMSVKTYKPGTKVQVNAGQFTEKGAKDMISIILPSNEVIDVQKKYLAVEI
jgi:hypothetical protein